MPCYATDPQRTMLSRLLYGEVILCPPEMFQPLAYSSGFVNTLHTVNGAIILCYVETIYCLLCKSQENSKGEHCYNLQHVVQHLLSLRRYNEASNGWFSKQRSDKSEDCNKNRYICQAPNIIHYRPCNGFKDFQTDLTFLFDLQMLLLYKLYSFMWKCQHRNIIKGKITKSTHSITHSLSNS